MRLIGHVTGEANAQLFSDYLSSLEIKSSIEHDQDNKWGVWIYSEDQVDAGKQHLTDYLAYPSDPKYVQKRGARQGEKASNTRMQVGGEAERACLHTRKYLVERQRWATHGCINCDLCGCLGLFGFHQFASSQLAVHE